MINVFNRRKLFTDSSAEQSAKVWSRLEEHRIPYEMKTMRNHTAFGRNIHASMSMQVGAGGMGYDPFSDNMAYVYVIYVRRQDYDRARALIA